MTLFRLEFQDNAPPDKLNRRHFALLWSNDRPNVGFVNDQQGRPIPPEKQPQPNPDGTWPKGQHFFADPEATAADLRKRGHVVEGI